MYYYSVNNYLLEKYNKKIYKLALKSGATCPNRDGTLGKGGCIFCSLDGSGSFAEPQTIDTYNQIENAKKRIIKKIPENSKFIAYFQDYSATYAPIEHLKNIFSQAIAHPDIEILSVATRPDCLPDEVLDLLFELNKIKPVWVELGFQTSNEGTARYIHRGYTNDCFKDSVKKLKDRGIYTVAHLIIGLPNDTEQDIYNSVDYVVTQGIDGIKLHLLHVLKGTKLEKDFQNNTFETLSLDRYCELVSGCLRRIPKTVAIHRLTGDGNNNELIAPLWSANKKHVLNTLNRYFSENNVQQGQLLD